MPCELKAASWVNERINENIAGNYAIINFKVVLLENGVIRRGHMENNLNNFYNKQQLFR